ncbi:Ankyrin repeat protein [Pelomyxa schiedti]|nr:Ankyrin repeat protein [Pelomyxa schiedti]
MKRIDVRDLCGNTRDLVCCSGPSRSTVVVPDVVRPVCVAQNDVTTTEEVTKPSAEETPKIPLCSVCGVRLSEQEQRAHYKSDWHSFNLKLKLSGGRPVSEQEFTDIATHGDVEIPSDEESPIESSDSEPEELVLDTGTPQVTFTSRITGDHYTLWKCVITPLLPSTTSADSFNTASVDALTRLCQGLFSWAFILCGGGYFAGAIYEHDHIVAHKTFHRYTVRKKQGGTQSTRDAKGHAPQSGGAGLRRYNEKRLTEDIIELMAQWSPQFRQCTHIFIHAPGSNRKLFVGKLAPFQPEDPRVQSIPFTTGRATLIEIAKAKQMLLSCTWEQRSAFDSVSGLLLELPKLDKEKALLALCAVARDTDSIQQIFQLVLTPVEAVQPLGGFQSATFFLLHSLCARGSLAEAQHLLHLITAIPNEASSAATCTPKILLSMQNGENGTCLHAASINGFGEAVRMLLESGSDPTIRDTQGKTAYDVALTSAARTVFRQFATEHPDMFDYSSVGIPPLRSAPQPTPTEEPTPTNTTTPSKKKKNKKRKSKNNPPPEAIPETSTPITVPAKPKKTNKPPKTAKATKDTNTPVTPFRSTSNTPAPPASKSTQAAPPAEGCCSYCSKPLPSEPFSRLSYVYCTTACVAAHRKQLS